MMTAPILAPAEPMGIMTPPRASATSYATSGGRLRLTTTRGGAAGSNGSSSSGSAVDKRDVDGGQGDGADDGQSTARQGDVDGPVRAAGLAELAGAVEGVDDPEATVARDVLEPLLRAHVVLGIEAVQLLDQELMGQPIPGRSQCSARRTGPSRSSSRACPAMVASAAASRCSAVRSAATTDTCLVGTTAGSRRRDDGRRGGCRLDESAVGGPAGQLVSGGELELAQDRRDV